VTIVLRDLTYLKFYTHERFIWASIIAKEWFNIIALLSIEEIDNLKKDLNGFTLNGEYCGIILIKNSYLYQSKIIKKKKKLNFIIGNSEY